MAYLLTGSIANGNLKKTNDFRPDPQVATGSAEQSDYRRSGHDRDHLCPAGEMRFDGEAMIETSNISPQVPSFKIKPNTAYP